MSKLYMNKPLKDPKPTEESKQTVPTGLTLYQRVRPDVRHNVRFNWLTQRQREGPLLWRHGDLPGSGVIMMTAPKIDTL